MYDVATVSKKISTHAFSVCKSIVAVTVLKAMDDVCILDCIGNLQIERVTLKISVMIIIIIHCVRKFTF